MKSKYVSLFAVLALCLFSAITGSAQINAPTFPATICAGAMQSVNYSATGAFGAGTVFSVELSNAFGSFASPVSIGSATLLAPAVNPSGAINTTIPGGTAEGGGYRVRVTSSAPAMVSADNGSNIMVKLSPTMNAVASVNVCNNASSSAVNFMGAPIGTTFAWTNTNTAIGLGASGNGNIASFTGTNAGTAPVSGIITVTPTLNGCAGTPRLFTITANPTPTVNPVSSQVRCAGVSTSAITFSGSVTGTSYTWTNDKPTIGLAANGSGNISSFTTTNAAGSPIVATIAVTPAANGCTGTPANFNITVNPIPNTHTVSNQVVCNGDVTTAVNFSGDVSNTTFTWVNNNTSVGLAAGNTGNISAFSATNSTTTATMATVTVTPTANGCTGSNTNFSYTVKPTPSVNTITSQSLCHGTATNAVFIGGPVAGTSFAWANNNTSIGLAANGSGNIAAFNATNSGNSPVTATVTVTPTANGCVGSNRLFTITVNPIPTVNAVPSQMVCNGATASQTFSSPVSGTTYAWTNSNASIGLAANGTGNIGSFTAINSGSINAVGSINVTPTANSCTGPVENFLITVKPTPVASPISNIISCNSTSAGGFTFGSTVSGTTYTWTNTNANIGLAASGSGNIPAFTTTNTGTTTISGTITVTPTANGCIGPDKTFTISVHPTATVNNINNVTRCNNVINAATTVSGPVSGTTFAWVNNNTAIGLAGSGSGNIPSFVTSNTGITPITGTITITPTANSCVGTPRNYSITVNPTPTVYTINNQTLCNGSATDAVVLSGPVSGSTFNWSNSTTSIGLGNSGSGNINSFMANNAGSVPVVATINVTPIANSCIGTLRSFTITVNPTPLVTPVSNQYICHGANTVDIYFSSAVSGTSFTWTNSLPSIGLAANGAGDIPAFTVSNPGTASVISTINVEPTANGCVGPKSNFTITAKPRPVMTSDDTAAALCNGTVFTYGPTSATVGTTFAWNRPAVTGISNPAAIGGGNPLELLNNTTPEPVGVTYIYTMLADGCSSNANVYVVINPTVKLSSPLTGSICSGNTFEYKPTSQTTGTAFAWKRAKVTGITPDTSAGGGNISDSLTNTTLSPIPVTYVYTLTANNCSYDNNLVVTVLHAPEAGIIATKSPATLCSKTICQNFGAGGAAGSGNSYLWTADNAVIWTQSADKQNALVSFPFPGKSTITLTTTIQNTGCISQSTYEVMVDSQEATTPQIVYHNNRFVCMQNDMDFYRWGYDDAATLDSTIITGETNQDYLNPNPDFTNKYYWVITRRAGCMQKTYYNMPSTIKASTVKNTDVKIYPNPAGNFITVEFEANLAGNAELKIYDMAGRLQKSVPADRKTTIDISSLTEGIYMVSCMEDGIRIATTKFIKH